MSEGSSISEQGWAGVDIAMPSLAAAAHELKSPLVLARQLGFMLQRDDL